MTQKTLLDSSSSASRVVDIDGIKAMFTEVFDGVYDVVLEINSQKFLLRMWNDSDRIENFEVIATKGFIHDLTNNLVLTLKNLVECLRLSLS